MNLSAEAIDRIVANVLNQFSTSKTSQIASPAPNGNSSSGSKLPAANPQKSVAPKANPSLNEVQISDSVITAETLQRIPEGTPVIVKPRAIITPAAVDIVRQAKLQIERRLESPTAASTQTNSKKETSSENSISTLGAAIVRHSLALDSALEELKLKSRELVSCPDDAAKHAISEISRNGVDTMLVFAEQQHRAACLANRNKRVKAVVVRDASDVQQIRKQLRANVWCLDPTDRSYYELKNVLKMITESGRSHS
ncbi:hypothetical protein KOR42_13550 [Thalassoglobus neptunius]|uniref:Uncharacterized protein n=1 Tax=Thalassoglobus neptunius TaxID=1938619 RepID=A0A5C5X4D8_9PLAN|nr:hypothetical protein [Thalassoglobus neptunius]TWT57987.1 hypothetical protein KOR42_13550 [Thalassoglobus neptunius]